MNPLTISAPVEGDWREQLEAALDQCVDIPAVNALAKANESGMSDYSALYPDRVQSLKTLFANKRGFLSQAPGEKK